MGAVSLRTLGLDGTVGLDLGRRCAVGICAVPLWTLGVHRRRLGMDAGTRGRDGEAGVCAGASRVCGRPAFQPVDVDRRRVAGVAWFPLGPREVYVPAYHVSPAYVQQVNVTNTTITNVNVTNVRYVNREVVGGVTAVPQSAFASSQPVGRAAVAVNPREIASAQVTGTAAIAPRQESVLGNVQGRGMATRPPAAIMNRPVVAKRRLRPLQFRLCSGRRLWRQIRVVLWTRRSWAGFGGISRRQ